MVTLSDITTADRKRIFSSMQSGVRSKDRISTLQRPRQENPPDFAWDLWRLALSHFSTKSILTSRLGPWIAKHHQKWLWYVNSTTNAIYFQQSDDTWLQFSPVQSPLPNTRRTRQTRTWYSEDIHSPEIPEVNVLRPTTIYQHSQHGQYIYLEAGTTLFLTTSNKQTMNYFTVCISID